MRELLQNVSSNSSVSLGELAQMSSHTTTQVSSHTTTQVSSDELISKGSANSNQTIVQEDSLMIQSDLSNSFNQSPSFEQQNTELLLSVSEINPQASVDITNPQVDNVENNIAQQAKRASALSLTSIRNRKELASSLEKNVISPDNLPKEPFTYNQLVEEWNLYTNRLLRAGLPLMASLMGMSRPQLNGARIELELPNAGSKLSFEENKYDLVNYLRKKMQNFDIELNIIVNEEIKLVKRVLDSKDKYQHFVELNPEMDKLRDIFDLEVK